MGLRVLRLLIAAIVIAASITVFAALSLVYSSDPYTNAVYSWGRGLKDYRADLRRKPAAVLRFADVQPGMKVVDLLGGAGYYTELISRIVGPEGHVYLQNNSLFLRFSTEGLEHRLRGGRLPNVTRLDSEFADMKLPQDLDIVFMGLSYHDIYVPREDPVIMTSREEFFPQVYQALKTGGKVLVIDHAAEPGSGKSAAAKLHRIDVDYAIKDFERAGFRLLAKLDILRNSNDNYSLDIWDDQVEDKTDKFILLFEKI